MLFLSIFQKEIKNHRGQANGLDLRRARPNKRKAARGEHAHGSRHGNDAGSKASVDQQINCAGALPPPLSSLSTEKRPTTARHGCSPSGGAGLQTQLEVEATPWRKQRQRQQPRTSPARQAPEAARSTATASLQANGQGMVSGRFLGARGAKQASNGLGRVSGVVWC